MIANAIYIDAANQEILDLEALDTLEIVDKAPDGETLYSTRMLWKDKPPLNGAPARCKGRLVVRNFKSDVNVNVFAPVCRIEAIRNLMSMVPEHPECVGCVHMWRDNEKSERVPALYSDSSNAMQNAHKHWVSPRL